MNAPFKLAAEFIAHALDVSPLVIALARLAFMESERRTAILEGRGLARIHVFRRRLPLMHRHRLGGPKSKLGDGVRLVRLGSQPYGADDDRSDLLGATMTRRNQPEAQLQRSLIEHLQWCARGDVWWTHIPNGGWRSPTEAAIFKLLGVRAGSPDLLIIRAGQSLFLELKAPGRNLSPAQTEYHDALRRAGATVETADNIDTLAFFARAGVMR
jgi:hypothetical protein